MQVKILSFSFEFPREEPEANPPRPEPPVFQRFEGEIFSNTTLCGVWYGTIGQPSSRPYPPRLLADLLGGMVGLVLGGQDHTPTRTIVHTIPRKKLEPWLGSGFRLLPG